MIARTHRRRAGRAGAALALLLPLLGSGATPATRSADVTVRWTPPTAGEERATGYRVRITSLEYREIEFAEIDAPAASGLALEVRMSGPAVACAWAVGWRGQPALPKCAPLTIPRQMGDRPERVEVDVGELPPPERDDRYQVRWPNAPRDFMLLARNDFDAPNGAPWIYTGREGRFELVEDSTAPDSPPAVGRAVYPAGFSGDGVEPFALDQPHIDQFAVRDLYIAFWLRLSDNWRGHTSGVNKILHIWNAGSATVRGSNIVFFGLTGQRGQPLRAQPFIQTPGFVRNFPPNVSHATIERGRWILVELLIIGSNGAAGDGSFRVWLTPPGRESVEVVSYGDVTFFGIPERRPFWSYVSWAPTWGGRGDAPVPETMMMDLDGILVMGR